MKKNVRENVDTNILLLRIFKMSNLQHFLSNNEEIFDMPLITDYLAVLCEEKNMVREHVIQNAGIERCFGHQLFRGARNISRDNTIRLAFGFGLTVEETQELLKIARRTPLYPKIKRDAVIIYGLSHKLTIVEMQCMLNELGLSALGGEKG